MGLHSGALGFFRHLLCSGALQGSTVLMVSTVLLAPLASSLVCSGSQES